MRQLSKMHRVWCEKQNGGMGVGRIDEAIRHEAILEEPSAFRKAAIRRSESVAADLDWMGGMGGVW